MTDVLNRMGQSLKRLAADQAGQVQIEWMLVLCVFGIPFVYVFSVLLSVLSEHYRRIAFFEALPFP